MKPVRRKKNFADVVTAEGWQNGEGAVVAAHTAFFRLCLAAQQVIEMPGEESVRQRNTGPVSCFTDGPTLAPLHDVAALPPVHRATCCEQVLLLQAVVTALQQDVDARLAVFRAALSSHESAAADEPARPVSSSMQALVVHSHLWRLLQVELTK